MKYTLDTNILVYAADRSFPLHAQAVEIRDRAAAERETVCLCFPVLLEFFAVITDPSHVRHPLSTEEAWQEVNVYLNTFCILYPNEGTWRRLSDLLMRYRIARQGVFDALIVALHAPAWGDGDLHGQSKGFRRFSEIEVLPWPE